MAIGLAGCAFPAVGHSSQTRRRKVAIAWRGVPLRPHLRAFAQQQDLQVFLDRRLDPDQEVNIELPVPLPPIRALDHVADSVGAAIVPLDQVLLIAPVPPANEIPIHFAALKQEVEQQWGSQSRQRRSLRWNDGATPRDVFRQAAQQFGVEVINPAAVPHDVWPGYQLPPIPVEAAFTVLLSGFGLTVEPLPARRARVIQARATNSAERWIALPDQPPSFASLRKQFPKIQWTKRTGWYVAKGPPSRVAAAADFFRQWDLQGGKVRAGARELYTLTVENQPVGAILRTLEQRAQIRFNVDDAAKAKLAQRVSFEVTRVPLRTLLKRTLDPIGLRFQMNGDRVEIQAREPNGNDEPNDG